MKEGQASRTAEYMALFRAIESLLPADGRLFEDPFARRFLSPPLAAVATLCRLPGTANLVARYVDRRWAGARSSGVARTRLIDDTIGAALGRGIDQVVILGTGAQPRGRLPSARVTSRPGFKADQGQGADFPSRLTTSVRSLRSFSDHRWLEN